MLELMNVCDTYKYLGRLKLYVHNRSRPGGSIEEGYLVVECLTFCSSYFWGDKTSFIQPVQSDVKVTINTQT